VRQTRCRSLPAAASVVGCQTPWKAARVRSSSLWVPSGRFDRASDSPCTTSRAPSETGRQLLPELRVRPSTEARGLVPRAGESGSGRGCAFPIVFGLASIRSLPAATSAVVIRERRAQSGVMCFGECAGSGVGRPPQGGRRASALRSELRWRRWPSGRRSRSRFQVGGELASDSRHGRRGGGNTSGQLDRVSSERAPER
jgi:hypothetical protein